MSKIIQQKNFENRILATEKNRNNFVLEEMKKTYDSLKELISKYETNEFNIESQ